MNAEPENLGAGAGGELWELASRACNDALRPADLARLESLLADDPQARRFYGFYMLMHAELAWRFRAGKERGEAGEEGGERGMAGLPAIEEEVGLGVGDSGFGIRNFNVPNLQISKFPNQQIPSLSTIHYPLSTNFVGGPVFSYIAATLILGVMLLSAWAYKITHVYGPSYTHNSRGSTTPGSSTPQPPELIFVARVTGMKDCRWSDPATETFAGAYVPLGRKYALSSGLMEITYRSGAKVILEGPCRYEVESDRGGFLTLGKLTARVEKRSEIRGQRSEVGGPAASAASMQPKAAKPKVPSPKPQAPRPKTEISKSPNLQISKSLFAVRTPTAVVTDLGTEFGVEVKDNGDTASYVFQGRVVVQSLAAPSTRRESSVENPKSQIPNQQILLSAGQSARVEKDAATGAARITTDEKAVGAPRFVRRMYEPPKLLDLLDIVAGGNGLGNRRERGIDPTSGMEDSVFPARQRVANHTYNPVLWNRFIDGVFAPDGRSGKVQLSSTGVFFDGFPPTDGLTHGSIWPRAAAVMQESERDGVPVWIYALKRAERFMPEGRGLLAMNPNSGVTFDLEAIRRTYKGAVPSQFRATAGVGEIDPPNPDIEALADVWVFVDDRPSWKRIGLRPRDDATDVTVDLGPADRFLTLVATDGGNGYARDYVVFGDPALNMQAIENTNPSEKEK